MSNIELIIEERAADIGNFMVGRLLPFREKRMVGPFIFIDHMGPVSMDKRHNMDIAPHPHIGLSTLTYLMEGSILHRDTLGTVMEINPGAVNWMTAGKGIVHSERTPEYLRGLDKDLHGLQIWVALPKDLEDMEPNFCHVSAEEVPAWEEGDLHYRLIAGEAFGRKSPVPVYSPLFFLEIKSGKRQTLNLGQALTGESGLYILSGSIETEEHTFGPKEILVAKDSSLCSFTMNDDTTVFLFGGTPFPEGRHIYWNFVSSSLSTIEKAKTDWLEQRFPVIPGETGFVPLPPQQPGVRQKQ
jgi:redox-sensitive bicupin YhaK (pirin superfamily)